MIYVAQSRPLNPSELGELRRLCEILKQGIPSRQDFTDCAEQLCLSIHSSGVFETGIPKAADRLLEYIDDLRKMLE